MNQSQKKKNIILVNSTIEYGTPTVVNKLPRIKVGEKIHNKIDAILKIAKDPLSKICFLLFLLSCFKVFHSQIIKLFMQFLYLFKSIKKPLDKSNAKE